MAETLTGILILGGAVVLLAGWICNIALMTAKDARQRMEREITQLETAKFHLERNIEDVHERNAKHRDHIGALQVKLMGAERDLVEARAELDNARKALGVVARLAGPAEEA
jgi:septal ring factor EnvC (AmiA/AmiB activator)